MCEAKDFGPKTKWDEILLKLKVWDQEKLHWILWAFVKVLDKVFPTFIHFSWHEQKLMKFSQYLTIFLSHFINIYLKSFRRFQNLTKIWDFMKVNNVSWSKQNFTKFLGIILYFIEYNAHISIVRTWISQWFLAKKNIFNFQE